MTDQKPPDPQSNENERPENWTWERPDDGSPVYGADAGATPGDVLRREPPPQSAQSEQPHYGPPEPVPYDLPSATAAPVFGAAKTPEDIAREREQAAQQHPQPPQYYQPPYPQQETQREPWTAAPPQPQQPAWPPPQDWQYQQQGWQQQQGQNPPPPPPYGQQQYPPDYGVQYPPPGYGQGQPPAPPHSNAIAVTALVIAVFSLIFVCCCQPVGIVGGIVAAGLAFSERRKARDRNDQNTIAEIAFWLAIGVVLTNLMMFIVGIVNYMMHPEQFDELLRLLGQ